MEQQYTTRTTCRVCGSTALAPLFSLGVQSVNNFPEDPDNLGVRCPIELELCRECTLVQLKHTAPQELLYTGNYWYASGVTQTMRDALRDVVQAVTDRVPLQNGDIVLDIGSNDGTLLRNYHPALTRVGVEPARNFRESGALDLSVFIPDFWSASRYWKAFAGDLWAEVPPTPYAKVITALGMFYDMEDPGAFVRDVAEVLAPDGVFVAQLMCLQNMLNLRDVGNLCHEHLEFYSRRSLDRLFGDAGLEIFDIETNRVNGESYRLWVRHRNSPVQAPGGAAARLAAARAAEVGLDDPARYAQFYAALDGNRQKTMDYLRRAKAEGHRIWILGASTKGNCIAQWYGFDPQLIVAAAERSPSKWGRYMVATGIPITSEDGFRQANPEIAVLLPYTFKEEVIRREIQWLMGGGRLLVPLPEPHVVTVDPKDMARRKDWTPPDRMPLLHCEVL